LMAEGSQLLPGWCVHTSRMGHKPLAVYSIQTAPLLLVKR
jgi:hypothetical protein